MFLHAPSGTLGEGRVDTPDLSFSPRVRHETPRLGEPGDVILASRALRTSRNTTERTLGQTSRSLRNRTKNTIATNPSSPQRARARVGRTGRIRYAFDNSMSRGTPALVAWLGAASLVLILAFATVITIFSLRNGEAAADGHKGFVDELFQTMLHTLDAGTVAGDCGKLAVPPHHDGGDRGRSVHRSVP